MNVLITGGCGFIGFQLAKYYIKKGYRVYILDKLFKTEGSLDRDLSEFLDHPNVHFEKVDMTKPFIEHKGLKRLPMEFSYVFHLAAINGTRLFYEMAYELCRNNLLLTINFLDWLKAEGKQVKRLVYTSTSEVYAEVYKLGLLEIPTDETVPVAFTQPTRTRFSYGTSKFIGSFLCSQFCKKYKISTTIIRYHNIYGPRMGNKHVIPEFIMRFNDGENPFKLFGGKETRAFCYIDDAVKATYRIGKTKGLDQEIVHVGNQAEEISIEDLARKVMDKMGKDVPIVDIKNERDSSVKRRCPNTKKLKEKTGFEAKVFLSEGLEKTVHWYLNQDG